MADVSGEIVNLRESKTGKDSRSPILGIVKGLDDNIIDDLYGQEDAIKTNTVYLDGLMSSVIDDVNEATGTEFIDPSEEEITEEVNNG